jgi:hypothetical protein
MTIDDYIQVNTGLLRMSLAEVARARPATLLWASEILKYQHKLARKRWNTEQDTPFY